MVPGTSDADGNALISFPAHPLDNLTTGTVIVLVQHPDACPAHVELPIDATPPVTLVRGTKIVFSAQSLPGVKITRVHVELADERRQAPFFGWTYLDDSLGATTRLPEGKYLARLAAEADDGKFYFSDAVWFSLPTSTPIPVERLPVRQGDTIKGMLDPAVPRPIEEGWINAQVAFPEVAPNTCAPLFLPWWAAVRIEANGSFVLRNLPPGTLQIIAVCTGYVSADTSNKGRSNIREGQVIAREDGIVTVPMEQTGSARITVLTPDGKPLPGATVQFNPNQKLGRITSIVGSRHDSAESRRNRADSSVTPIQRFIPRFDAVTDEHGIAVIRELPAGEDTFTVRSELFDMPIEVDEQTDGRRHCFPRIPRRMARVKVLAGAEVSAQIRMETKGSASLSAAIQAVRPPRRCG
jgi:hypothetical protein